MNGSSGYPSFHSHMQGIIHPIIVLIIWSDAVQSISPYRFCVGILPDYNCTLATPSFLKSMYVLDFAGSGAVHMLGKCLLLCVPARSIMIVTSWALIRRIVWFSSVPICKAQTLEAAQAGTYCKCMHANLKQCCCAWSILVYILTCRSCDRYYCYSRRQN